MARKKAAKKMTEATAEKTKPVRLDLSPEEHRLLRMLAASAEKSMAAYARLAIGRVLREEAKKQGIK